MTAFRASILAAAALAAAGCAGSPPPEGIITTSADLHKPVVTEEVARLDLAPRGGLDAAQRDAVTGFLRQYRQLGHGPLVVSAPSRGDAEALAADVRQLAAQSGGGAAMLTPAVDVGGGYSLSFVRYRAHAPECGRVWPSLSQTARSETYPNFGCAQNANLAAMIADPADLIRPRDMTPADGAQRQRVLDAYRAGESTAADNGDGVSITGLGN